MARGAASYPHPVLGNQDDVTIGDPTQAFSNADYSISDEKVTITLRGLRTDNPTIDQLVMQKKAHWVARLQCAGTYFRMSKTTCEQMLEWNLDGRELSGNCRLEVEVCARQVIDGYRPEGVHDDYGDCTFLLEPGAIIAIGGSARFNVDKEFDPLKAAVGSIMKVRKGEHETGAFRVDLTGPLIEVELSKQDWDRYHAAKQHVPGLLHATLVLPALMMALEKREHPDYKGLTWPERLTVIVDSLLETGGVLAQEPVELAQALLRCPFSRGIDEFKILTESEF